MIAWIKTLLRIVKTYDKDYQLAQRQLFSTAAQIHAVEKIMKERTEIHADLPAYRGYPATVIVCGRYRDKDYVEVFQLREQDFSSIVEHLKELGRYGNLKHVDASFQMKYVLERELKGVKQND